MTIEELQVVLTANTAQFKKELGTLRSEINKITGATDDISKKVPKHMGIAMAGASAFGNILANVVTAGFHAVTASVGDAIKRLDTLKAYPNVMAGLGFSADDSKKSLDMLNEGILGLPTSLDQIVRSTQQLATVSPNLASATKRALAMNNAFLASGASQDSATQAGIQFNQMLATGKPDMQSWNSIQMTMPAQLQQVAKSMLGASASSTDLRDAMMDGKITTGQLADEFVKLNENGANGFASFADQAKSATGGIGTSIANMHTALVRGLANIMDAIGQANIAGFFNWVASAINSVIPVVIGFVQAIIMAVGWVATLFGAKGSKGSEGVKKNIEATNNAMAKTAGNAGGVGKALDGASGKAKKLKQQLAGFDEMNVLTEDTGDSGGSGGGGGGAGGGQAFEFPEPDTSKATNKAQQMADKIKSILASIANSPFVKGFVLVFESVAEAIGVVVGWLGKFVVQPIIDFFAKIMENEVVKGILEAVAFAVGMLVGALTLGLIVFGLWNLIVGIATAVTGAFTVVMGILTSPIVLVVAAIALLITGIVLLVKNWETVSRVAGEVWANIVAVWNIVAEWFKTNVIDPVVKFFADLWAGIQLIFNNVVNWFKDIFQKAWLGIQIIWSVVVAYYSGIWNGIVAIFSGVGNWFAGVFQGAWNGIKSIFGGVGSFFVGIWNTITGIFGSIGTAIGNGIAGAFKTVVNAILGFAENTINGFIRAINVAIDLINKIPGVNVGKLSTLSVPRLATGGVIDKATLAVVGESGREAVMPLENNTGWITELANKIGQRGGGQAQTIIVKIGEETLIRKVVDGINDLSYQQGETVIQL